MLFLAVFRQYLVQCQLTLAGSRSSEETLLYTAHTLIGSVNSLPVLHVGGPIADNPMHRNAQVPIDARVHVV